MAEDFRKTVTYDILKGEILALHQAIHTIWHALHENEAPPDYLPDSIYEAARLLPPEFRVKAMPPAAPRLTPTDQLKVVRTKSKPDYEDMF